MNSDHLPKLLERQAFIEATTANVNNQLCTIPEAQRSTYKVQKVLERLELLKVEYKENEKKITALESIGATAKRPVGRPKKISGDNFFLPDETDNRLRNIQNMELSIDKDLEAIEEAKSRLAKFIEITEGKIAAKRLNIAQTKAKLNPETFTPEEL